MIANWKLKGAFTLIELLVVVAILAILSSFIAFAGLGHIKDARDSARKSDLATLRRALTYYYFDHLNYPDPGIYAGGDGVVHGSDSRDGPDWIPGLRPDYLKTLPRDPKQAGVMTLLASLWHNSSQGQVLGMATANKGFYTSDSTILDNPLVTGQYIAGLDWKDLETSRGVYSFNKIKTKMDSAFNASARVRLKIGAGNAAPPWIAVTPNPDNTCNTSSLGIPNYYVVPPNVDPYCAPYVWNDAYLTELNNFLSNLGNYLENTLDPGYKVLIAGINVPGGPAYSEMITPGGSAAFAQATSIAEKEYTKIRYRDAWKNVINTMTSSMPTIPLIINLSQTWDEANSGGTPLTAFVATEVGDWALSQSFNSRVELQNASVPDTFGDLVPYFQSKGSAGVAISAQIGWFKMPQPPTYDALCNAYKTAYDLGARSIEVNAAAFKNASLKPATEKWDPALKRTGPEPTDCAGTIIPPSLTCSPASSSVGKDEIANLSARDGTGPYTWSALGGNPTSGIGASFSVSFSSEGTSNNVVVTDSDGAEATCVVDVTTTGGEGGGAPVYFYIYTVAADLQTFTLSAKLEGDGTQYTLPAYPGSPPVIPEE